MPIIVKILISLPFFLGLFAAPKHPYQKWCEKAFQADSGFINSTQEKELLLLICKNDTAVFTPEYRAVLQEMLLAPDSTVYDSSGKYYRGREINGERQWVLCVVLNMLTAELPFVMEFRERKGVFTLNSYGFFFHGNYACCWENQWREFSRLGPYFYVETCGTGSGFCSGDANVLFFPLTPNPHNEDSPPSIPLMWWQSYLLSEDLEGRLRVSGDTIIADYTYQVDTLIENAAEEMIPHPVSKTRFTARFQIDPQQRKIRLLNPDSVLSQKSIGSLFEEN